MLPRRRFDLLVVRGDGTRVLQLSLPRWMLAAALGSVALSVELFAWSERNRERPLARAFRRPGFEMQRLFATREPTPEQLEVGRAALAEILRLEVPALGAH